MTMSASPSGPLMPRRKVFLQRDYSDGVSVQFSTSLPQELVGLIEVDRFQYTVNTINNIFRDGERMTFLTFAESSLACLSAYLVYCCMDSQYDRCLKKVGQFINEQNKSVWRPRGLLITNPIERGLRVIEVVIEQDHRSLDPSSQPQFVNAVTLPGALHSPQSPPQQIQYHQHPIQKLAHSSMTSTEPPTPPMNQAPRMMTQHTQV